MASRRKDTDQGSLATAASEQLRTIIAAAEQTAGQIRADAEQEAARIRRLAEEEASGIRSDAHGDVQALLDSIREGVSRLAADLARLEDRLQPAAQALPAPREPAPRPTPAAPEPAAPAEPEPTGDSDADTESARLVALNMALDGSSRDEVDRYLSENFALANRRGLLDEVYASIGS